MSSNDRRNKVFVTRKIPEAGINMLKKHHEVVVSPHNRVLTTSELINGIKNADGLLCLLTDPITAEVMDANPELKVISNYAVGYNNIDVVAATARGIQVTNTPGVLTDTTADLAWSLIMAVGRRVVEGDVFTRAGRFSGWDPMLLLGSDITGKTLGIIGMGRIGQAVARRAMGFDMPILYHDVAPMAQVEEEYHAQFAGLDELLKESDFVTIHAPLTPETRHMIGQHELRLMKKTAYLINTARGPLVDEHALVEALKEGAIAGAGLDVYEDEPELAPGLAELPNIVLLPHLGSATLETRTKMAEMAAANLLAALKGKRPPHIVNPEVL
ncbi:MAG: D-glycerate dehydrogenase [Firmicutes bacterium]|nr:D-glycerate dehydrogenase [Bacillota bacterium]